MAGIPTCNIGIWLSHCGAQDSTLLERPPKAALKSTEITNKVDNDMADKYIAMLADTISACVIATNQTYVEALKKNNAFTAEAQKEAFNLTYNAVMAVLTDEAKQYLTAIYGDLTAYITNKIEAEVNISKIVPVE